MSRRGKPNRLSVWATVADHWNAILTVVTTIASVASTVVWYRVDSEKRVLEVRLSEAQVQNETMNAAVLKPRFSVQYLLFGGAVYAAVKGGEDNPEPFGAIRKTKEAQAAYESLYEFPLIDTELDTHLIADRLDGFLVKYSARRLGKRTDELNAIRYTVLVISCFGGSTARDVELMYEERKLDTEPFIFPRSGIRYSDNLVELASNAPREGVDSLFRKTSKSLKLGDIEPGHGRIVPIQVGLSPEGVMYDDGTPAVFEVLASFHLKPISIRYKTLANESLEQPIREQLAIPMPVSDFIDIRG